MYSFVNWVISFQNILGSCYGLYSSLSKLIHVRTRTANVANRNLNASVTVEKQNRVIMGTFTFGYATMMHTSGVLTLKHNEQLLPLFYALGI